jgi:hypothetical protein
VRVNRSERRRHRRAIAAQIKRPANAHLLEPLTLARLACSPDPVVASWARVARELHEGRRA